jgi:hypothetical protein
MSELSSTPDACRLFEAFLDRHQAHMPDIYVPDSKGALVAGEDILRAAGYCAGSRRPPGWRKYAPGVFVKPLSSEFTLEVRQCGNSLSNLWTIERSNHFASGYCVETLVCALEDVPIHAKTYQGAMRVAEYCHPSPQAPVPGRWIRAWYRH